MKTIPAVAVLVTLVTALSFLPTPHAATDPDCPSAAPGSTVKFIQPGNTTMKPRYTHTTTLGVPTTFCVAEPGSSCAIGFILRDGAGQIYATTAGHCVDLVQRSNGDIVYAMHPVYGAWGVPVVVRAGNDPVMPSRDIAVIRVFPEFVASVEPSLPLFGGPTGEPVDFPEPTENDPVVHTGLPGAVQGYPMGIPRIGLFVDMNETRFLCVCMTFSGDSGSPMIDLRTGMALGQHTMAWPKQYVNVNGNDPANSTILVHQSPDPDHPRLTAGVNLTHELHFLRGLSSDDWGDRVDWQDLELVTAPLTAEALALMAGA